MRDFFRVLGKAFAIVFGSTSALAIVLVLVALAMRPVLRSWSYAQANSPPTSQEPAARPETTAAINYSALAKKYGAISSTHECLTIRCPYSKDEPPGFTPACEIHDSRGTQIGSIGRAEIEKALGK